jgi:hypothetical protein
MSHAFQNIRFKQQSSTLSFSMHRGKKIKNSPVAPTFHHGKVNPTPEIAPK